MFRNFFATIVGVVFDIDAAMATLEKQYKLTLRNLFQVLVLVKERRTLIATKSNASIGQKR